MSNSDQATHKRAAATPRATGMAHMIEATLELLDERPIDRITLRDVAERAGHHHRFVAAWFGGKAGLLTAALDHEISLLPPVGRAIIESGNFDPRTVRLVHLLNWLVANQPGALAQRGGSPLIDAISNSYLALGLSGDDSRQLAQLMVAAAAGFVLFGEVLNLRPGDLSGIYELHLRMVTAITPPSE